MNQEVFVDVPFSSPVVFKLFGNKHHGDPGGQWALRDRPVVLRRFPEYVFDKKDPVTEMHRLESTYRRFGALEYLKVPQFLTVRVNCFPDEARLKPYYMMVEEIQGKNLQDVGMLHGRERDEAIRVFNHAYEDFAQYARSLYETGGSFDSDQMTHNYVYGKGWHDEEPRLYYVDLELKGLREYNAEHRAHPQNYDYFQFIVGGLDRWIAIVEQYVVGTELSSARESTRKFIDELLVRETAYREKVQDISSRLFQL